MKTIRKRLIYFSFLICYMLVACHARAQHEPVYTTLLQGDSIQVGKTITVQDTVFFNPLLQPSILRTNFVNNIITLRINEFSNRMLPDSFNVSVRVRIYYIDKNNLQDSVTNDTLRLTYNKNKVYNSRTSKVLKDAYWMQVKVLEIIMQYATNEQVLHSLEIENRLTLDRDFVMSCTDNAIKTVSKDILTIAEEGELKVFWTPERTAETYDLEWTFIDKSALDRGTYNTGGDLDPKLIFRNNATRITTAASSYMIPLLYDGEGSLFFRVRGVQQEPNGELIASNWSSDYVSLGGLGRYDFTGHERKLNWQATTTFAEQGKRKTVVQYYDGSLKGRQTVTKDNTTQTTVVAETLYDKQGRPMIQIMPAPTLSKLIEYSPGFNVLDMNGNEYDKGIYDTLLSGSDYCSAETDSMSVGSGASRYYSPLNELVNEGYHKFIPDAKGYAFTATQYSQDNTGRIYRQSGVGRDFRIGSGKETKYYYGNPEQTDLDALFGTEAGDASHYQKNMVRDANGQYSVSYIDMHGRTVATALAGTPPASLQQLSSYRDSVQTESLLNPVNNVISGSSIRSVKSLLNPRADSVTFHYSLGSESLSLEDCQQQNICYDCLYDLRITITDDCNNQLLGGSPVVINKNNFKLFEIDTTCQTATPIDTTFKVYLSEGSYTVTKELSISQYGLNYYRDSLYLPHNTCLTYDSILQQQIDSIRIRMACTEDSLNRPFYLSHREQMLLDLYPVRGQYADIIDSTNWKSIFDLNTTTGKYLYQQVADTGIYRNENGDPDLVMNTAGNLVPPQQLTISEFIDQFKDSWLDNLLSLHPEHCLLVQYERFVESHVWDDDFGNTATYQEALAKGYLNPTGNSTTLPASRFTINVSDPLYSYNFTGNVKQVLEDSLFHFRSNTGDLQNPYLSIWGLATISARCPEPTTEECAYQWNGLQNVFSVDSLCDGELDMAWRIFREMYLEEKREWIDNFIRQQCAVPYPQAPLYPVFPRRDSLLVSGGFSTGGSPADATVGQAQEQAYYAANCEAYAPRWRQQLESCGYSTAQLDVVIGYLTEVCKQGADPTHPAGSSTTRPGNTYRFSSFEQVIQFVNDSLGRPTNSSCNGYLINQPMPYNQPAFLVRKEIWGKPDSCECSIINNYYNLFIAVQGQYNNFSHYLDQKLRIKISQGALDTLRGLCNDTIACKFITQPIILPPALQCGTGDVCIDCIQFRPAYDSFLVKFPGILPAMSEEDTLQRQINTLFANYMNAMFGFSKTAQEYLIFKDSCATFQPAPQSGDTVLTCDKLNYLLAEYHQNYIDPASGYVDLDMRTFAGNKTHPEGSKGVFDVNGKLIGNTVSGSLSQINNSYASIWNSSIVNQSIGFLTALPDGRFRLRLNTGQQAPCNGIIGQRYYQFEAHPLDSLAGNFQTGDGSYIDFGDNSSVFIKGIWDPFTTIPSVLIFNDGQTTVREIDYSGYFGDHRYYVPERSTCKFFTVNHKYFKPTGIRQTYTITVYHSDLKGVIGFFGPRTDFADPATSPQTNLRGYFPQQTISIQFQGIQDSTLCRTSQIYNFSQINSIERIGILNYNNSAAININLGSFANNHNLQYVQFAPYFRGISNYLDSTYLSTIEGQPFHKVFPDLPNNFPKIGYLEVAGLNSREYYLDSIKFELPQLRHFTLNYHDTVLSYQIDSILNQIARVNNQTNGTGWYGIGGQYNGPPTAASAAAVQKFTTNGWNILNVNSTTSVHYNHNFSNIIWDRDSLVRTNAFTDFVNQRLGAQFTFDELQEIHQQLCNATLSLCNRPAIIGPSLCGKNEAMDETIFVHDDPCADSTNFAIITATEIFRLYKDSLIGHFNEAYTQKCLQAVNLEQFTVTHPVSEYHYTLYYYDLAGNLVKTIPPEGVRPNREPQWLEQVKQQRSAGFRQVPEHTLPTVYRYNSLNQVVTQSTPDAGFSRFWYDRLGRLAISQNLKQKTPGKYSYTKYDALGRITEVGEKLQYNSMSQEISRVPLQLKRWLELGNSNATHAPKQVTVTTYDVVSNLSSTYAGFTSFRQKAYTLRNRVSYTRLHETPDYFYTVQGTDTLYTLNDLEYNSAVEYSYDIHGNVDSLLNLYGTGSPLIDHGANRYKLIAYQYDLISGKVNQVHYQPGANDELYHRYEYDAENRLTDVYITDQKAFIGQPQLEEHEAFYQYYKHGPLARSVIGQQQVQGLDYAYTLQGWLKGVNSMSLNPNYDMGGDGLLGGANNLVARDAYGFNLNYFTGEYSPIKTTVNSFPGHSAFLLGSEYKPLYNGNISSMAVNIGKFNQPQLYNYQYDQLNRIVGMDAYRGFNESANNWSALALTTDYKERISYDANGNIKKYLRNGTVIGGPLDMDSLTYNYNLTGGVLINNRLRHVRDAVGDNNYTVDIDNQPEDNYMYDDIGNLIKDTKEGIDQIDWTVYGKISRILKANGTEIKYSYDPAGNRITKAITASSQTTYTSYVRDANGNVIAVYEQPGGSDNMKLKEQHLYGSSRLGLWQRDQDIDQPKLVISNVNLLGPVFVVNFERGNKFFELSNHLGNVLVTVSDKKFGHDAGNGAIDYYNADIITATDYAPFGMQMVGRSFKTNAAYRYGFNGKENDNDVKGEGNQQDYGMRIYDPRLGRFLSVDPLTQGYPWYTPYQFAGNIPIWAIDLDGEEEKKITNTYSNKSAGLTFQKIMKEYQLKEAIVNEIYSAINKQIISREGDYTFRSNDEANVIKSEILKHVAFDHKNNSAQILHPDNNEPSIIYTILEKAVTFATNEAAPVATQAAGVITEKVGNLLTRTANNVEGYTTKFTKKYFPQKYADAIKINTTTTKGAGQTLGGLGKVFRVGGRALGYFGNFMMAFDVLNAGSPEYKSDDDFKRITREKLKEYILSQIRDYENTSQPNQTPITQALPVKSNSQNKNN